MLEQPGVTRREFLAQAGALAGGAIVVAIVGAMGRVVPVGRGAPSMSRTNESRHDARL
jgi:hypothetical protein